MNIDRLSFFKYFSHRWLCKLLLIFTYTYSGAAESLLVALCGAPGAHPELVLHRELQVVLWQTRLPMYRVDALSMVRAFDLLRNSHLDLCLYVDPHLSLLSTCTPSTLISVFTSICSTVRVQVML